MEETPLCRHFTSLLEDRCAAGICYRDAKEQDKQGIRYPCVRPDRPAWDTKSKPAPECEKKEF
jgi:hypothetical protein